MSATRYRTCLGGLAPLESLYFCDSCRTLRPNTLEAVAEEPLQFYCPQCMRTQVPRAAAGVFHRYVAMLSSLSGGNRRSLPQRAPVAAGCAGAGIALAARLARRFFRCSGRCRARRMECTSLGAVTAAGRRLLLCVWRPNRRQSCEVRHALHRARTPRPLPTHAYPNATERASGMGRPASDADVVGDAAAPLLQQQQVALEERGRVVGVLHISDRVRQQRGSPVRRASSPWASPASVSSALSPASHRPRERAPHGPWRWEDADHSCARRAEQAQRAAEAASDLVPRGVRRLDPDDPPSEPRWCGECAAACDAALGPTALGSEEARGGRVPLGMALLPRKALRCSTCHSAHVSALLRVPKSAVPKSASNDQLTRIGTWLSKCLHAHAYVPTVECTDADPAFPVPAGTGFRTLRLRVTNPSHFEVSPVAGDVQWQVLAVAAAAAAPQGCEGVEEGGDSGFVPRTVEVVRCCGEKGPHTAPDSVPVARQRMGTSPVTVTPSFTSTAVLEEAEDEEPPGEWHAALHTRHPARLPRSLTPAAPYSRPQARTTTRTSSCLAPTATPRSAATSRARGRAAWAAWTALCWRSGPVCRTRAVRGSAWPSPWSVPCRAGSTQARGATTTCKNVHSQRWTRPPRIPAPPQLRPQLGRLIRQGAGRRRLSRRRGHPPWSARSGGRAPGGTWPGPPSAAAGRGRVGRLRTPPGP